MIIDLNLTNKNILIIGAGQQCIKKVKPFTTCNCNLNIIIISETINEAIYDLPGLKNMTIIKEKVKNGKFLDFYDNIFMVIATTNDAQLNKDIVERAKEKKIITYSIDDPVISDFSFMSIINIEQVIQIAISTSGRSPIMTKIIKEKIENNIKNIIDRSDIENVRVQEFARQQAKKYIPDSDSRRGFLYELIRDKAIQRLIKKNNIDKVKERIISTLEKWEDNKDR